MSIPEYPTLPSHKRATASRSLLGHVTLILLWWVLLLLMLALAVLWVGGLFIFVSLVQLDEWLWAVIALLALIALPIGIRFVSKQLTRISEHRRLARQQYETHF